MRKIEQRKRVSRFVTHDEAVSHFGRNDGVWKRGNNRNGKAKAKCEGSFPFDKPRVRMTT
jgi:hypothetical protein